MKLTETEKIAKQILEGYGWTVFKPSWPDFLIYNSINPLRYCFVEVKRNGSEHISKGQLETGYLLKELGFSYSLFSETMLDHIKKGKDNSSEVINRLWG